MLAQRSPTKTGGGVRNLRGFIFLKIRLRQVECKDMEVLHRTSMVKTGLGWESCTIKDCAICLHEHGSTHVTNIHIGAWALFHKT